MNSKYKKPKLNHLKPKNHAFISLGSLFVLALSATAASGQTFSGWEYSLFKLFYNLPIGLKPVFLALTQLGSAWMVLIICMIALLKHVKGLAHKVLINGTITYIAAEYLKRLIGRPRPPFFYHSIVPRELFVSGNGFPSGHTAMATVLALTMLPYLPKKYYWLLPTWIISVAMSRMYLGVHAPLDIIGGVALGVLIASLQHLWTASKAQRKHLKKRKRGTILNTEA